jgi:acetylglutamate kinase
VSADEAARAIAVAMQAEKTVYLTAVPGLLDDAEDERTLVPPSNVEQVRARIHGGTVVKGMIPKLRACADAVDQGVSLAHIIDGRVAHSLLIELLTHHGVGTMISSG